MPVSASAWRPVFDWKPGSLSGWRRGPPPPLQELVGTSSPCQTYTSIEVSNENERATDRIRVLVHELYIVVQKMGSSCSF